MYQTSRRHLNDIEFWGLLGGGLVFFFKVSQNGCVCWFVRESVFEGSIKLHYFCSMLHVYSIPFLFWQNVPSRLMMWVKDRIYTLSSCWKCIIPFKCQQLLMELLFCICCSWHGHPFWLHSVWVYRTVMTQKLPLFVWRVYDAQSALLAFSTFR